MTNLSLLMLCVIQSKLTTSSFSLAHVCVTSWPNLNASSSISTSEDINQVSGAMSLWGGHGWGHSGWLINPGTSTQLPSSLTRKGIYIPLHTCQEIAHRRIIIVMWEVNMQPLIEKCSSEEYYSCLLTLSLMKTNRLLGKLHYYQDTGSTYYLYHIALPHLLYTLESFFISN